MTTARPQTLQQWGHYLAPPLCWAAVVIWTAAAWLILATFGAMAGSLLCVLLHGAAQVDGAVWLFMALGAAIVTGKMM